MSIHAKNYTIFLYLAYWAYRLNCLLLRRLLACIKMICFTPFEEALRANKYTFDCIDALPQIAFKAVVSLFTYLRFVISLYDVGCLQSTSAAKGGFLIHTCFKAFCNDCNKLVCLRQYGEQLAIQLKRKVKLDPNFLQVVD